MMNKITRSLVDIVNKIKRCNFTNLTSFDFIHNFYQAFGYLIHHSIYGFINALNIFLSVLSWTNCLIFLKTLILLYDFVFV